jgi:hypothetical protein
MSRSAETQFKQMQDQTPDRLKELHRCHVAGAADGVAVRDFATHVKVPPPVSELAEQMVREFYSQNPEDGRHS